MIGRRDPPCICQTFSGAISLVLSTKCFLNSFNCSFSSGQRVLVRETADKTDRRESKRVVGSVCFQLSSLEIRVYTGRALREENVMKKEKKGLAGASVVQFLELCQALNFYHRLTQSHSLQFAKKESLDLVHWIILSDHCSIHLRPWNHNQLTPYSHQESSGITPS